jgi:hypothetical protein
MISSIEGHDVEENVEGIVDELEQVDAEYAQEIIEILREVDIEQHH